MIRIMFKLLLSCCSAVPRPRHSRARCRPRQWASSLCSVAARAPRAATRPPRRW